MSTLFMDNIYSSCFTETQDPDFFKAERYAYCDDFSSICTKNEDTWMSKLKSAFSNIFG